MDQIGELEWVEQADGNSIVRMDRTGRSECNCWNVRINGIGT